MIERARTGRHIQLLGTRGMELLEIFLAYSVHLRCEFRSIPSADRFLVATSVTFDSILQNCSTFVGSSSDLLCRELSSNISYMCGSFVARSSTCLDWVSIDQEAAFACDPSFCFSTTLSTRALISFCWASNSNLTGGKLAFSLPLQDVVIIHCETGCCTRDSLVSHTCWLSGSCSIVDSSPCIRSRPSWI